MRVRGGSSAAAGIGTGPPVSESEGFDGVGQVITVPAGDTRLSEFSCAVAGSARVQFEIYAWDGTRATGPALFQNPPVLVPDTGPGRFTEITAYPALDLIAGNQYGLFATGIDGNPSEPGIKATFVSPETVVMA